MEHQMVRFCLFTIAPIVDNINRIVLFIYNSVCKTGKIGSWFGLTS